MLLAEDWTDESGKAVLKTNVFHPFHPWSPNDPFLYDVKITLGEDEVRSYFAMREFAVRQDEHGVMRLVLNGKPLFHSGVLDQGYWPDGLYTAPSDEAMIEDICAMKRLGFNMLRKHIKIEPLRWYYHCDRLGMLVWQDMVSGGVMRHFMLKSALSTLGVTKLRDDRYGFFGRRDRPPAPRGRVRRGRLPLRREDAGLHEHRAHKARRAGLYGQALPLS